MATNEFYINPDIKSHHLLPEVLCSRKQHISAEDPEWAACPVPALSDIIVSSAEFAKGPEIKNLIQNATNEQSVKIKKILPLDIPLKFTLPLLDMEAYWKRQCLNRWSCVAVWKHGDSWKKMFIERFVQEAVQNFEPESSNISELIKLIEIFSCFKFRLVVRNLRKKKMKHLQIDLRTDDFDSILDEFIDASEESSIFLDFQAVLCSLPNLEGVDFIPIPSSFHHGAYKLPSVDFNSFFNGLKQLQCLEEFRCANGFITNEQLKLLCKLFLNKGCLKKLDLSHNSVDDSCCDYLAKLLLSPSCCLEYLVLKNNKISSDGAQVIAAGLSRNKSLKILDLSLNLKDDESGELLAMVLSNHEIIADIDVSKNKIRSRTGLAFAKWVMKSKSLRKLNVSKNNLGKEAGAALRKAVECNSSLLHLGIEFCQFSPEDEDMIHQCLIRNRSSFGNEIFKSGQNDISQYVI